ncbi:adenosylmethionine decarboxylase [Undibacterium sp. Ren11W]|uniref:adenosylmethionine decarboxylase n=1 Tax=Undibacterium sp. Ren11W TaxID=3413045 RepID=UPI003BF438D7
MISAPVTEASYRPSGQHLIADLYGIAPDKLRDGLKLEALLRAAALAAGAHILFSHFHSFDAGQGITGVVLLAESHITIHTWPEHGYAALDIFICGQAQAEHALQHIKQTLQASHCELNRIQRGQSKV